MLVSVYGIHKRGIEVMSRKNKKKKTYIKPQNGTHQKSNESYPVLDTDNENGNLKMTNEESETTLRGVINKKKLQNYFKEHPLFTALVTGILSTIILGIFGIICKAVYNGIMLPNTIEELDNSLVESIDSKFAEIQSGIDEEFEEIRVQVSTIGKIIGINFYSSLEYSDEFTESITKTYETVELQQYFSAPNQNESVIARDTINGKEYMGAQLSGQTLLIPYQDGKKDVLFYGQYDEKNCWDGTCVFNIYEDERLELLLEAEYENGKLKSYKKVSPDITKSGKSVWSISSRKNEGHYNSGETWNYLKAGDYKRGFDWENVEVEDLISIEDFENNIKAFSELEGYYFGNTSNGFYNDNTGTAYMIKYREDGIIRTLYVGEFKDGDFYDTSGKAWEIVFDESENINKYFYYQGKFKKEGRVGRVTKDNYVTQEEINEIIGDMTFNCQLNWYTNGN